MRPALFQLFGESAPAYFVMLAVGFLFATAVGVQWARRIGESADVIVDLSLAMLLAGLVGSRILHVLADGFFMDYVHACTNPALVDWHIERGECVSESYRGVWDAAAGVCHPAERDCLAWAKFWNGGLTYYGGFLGASAVAVFVLRRDRFPFWRAADMSAFAIPLGLAFGRLGCLLAGCCFGAQTNAWWGISFPPRSAASEAQYKAHALASSHLWSTPVHPTQVYESVASLAIAAFCFFVVHPRKRYDGHVFAWMLALYAVARFGVEILRRDDRGGALGLSTSQLISIGLFACAAALHAKKSRTLATLPPSPSEISR